MPGVRRILVGVHGSLGSLQALRYAAAEARERDVPLIPVIAWTPPVGQRRVPGAGGAAFGADGRDEPRVARLVPAAAPANAGNRPLQGVAARRSL